MTLETEKHSRILDLSRLGTMSPAERAAFWIQAEIKRVNQETGRGVILPARTVLAEIIAKEFPK